MALRITDYVHRGNGVTISFSDGDVCDITYEFDVETQKMVRNGCPNQQKLFLIQQLLDSEPIDELGAVDGRFIDRRPEYRSDTFTVPSGGSITRDFAISRVVQTLYFDPPLGNLFVPAGTFDPTNVSTIDANLINNNLTDLCYNNTSLGSAGKELPAIDYGTVQLIDQVAIYWWNQAYIATSFTLETSLTGASWTSYGPFTGTWLGTSNPQFVGLSGAAGRYLRLRCITGADVNFIVVSEMRGYEKGPAPNLKQVDLSRVGLEAVDVGGVQTRYDNSSASPVDMVVYYLVG